MAAASKPSRRVELAVGLAVCVAGAVLVYAMLLAEGIGVRDELMLAAPEAARPGETIALRAYVYHDPDAAEGPTPENADVRVELHEGARVLSEVRLASGAQLSLEGSIAVPREAHGTLYLVARATDQGHLLATEARPLAVADDAAPAASADRVASPLSHFQLGPLVVETTERAGESEGEGEREGESDSESESESEGAPHVDTLDARVVGGVCVPEVPCIVAVDVGLPSVEPRLTNCANVDVLPPLPVTGVATRYYRVPFVVHGPEGTCDLTAVSVAVGSVGQVLAHRSIRFPVALATPYFALSTGRSATGLVECAAVAPPGRDGVVIDVFREGRWTGTYSMEASSDPSSASTFRALPGQGALAEGHYLVQARADVLPTAYLAPRALIVDHAARDPEAGTQMAEEAFELAQGEQHGLALPAALSGLAGDRARLESRKRIARTIAFAGMAVGILLLVVTVLRRGLSADAQARALMAAAGVAGADDASARRRGRLTVILMVLALGLACATGAALIAAHDLALDTAPAAP